MTKLVDSEPGVRVAVHDLGGHGPPLLIVHATGFHGLAYTEIALRLRRRFRVFAADLRGHGDSEITDDTPFEWDGLAADVTAACRAVADEPIAAFGHSMGGAALAMAEVHRPGTISSAWMFEPVLFEQLPESVIRTNPLAAVARRRREVFESREVAFERYVSRPPFSSCDPASVRHYVDHGFVDLPDGTVRLKCRAEHEARTFESSFDHGVWHRLGEVTAPITVVGSGDGGPPALVAEAVASQLVNGRFERWPEVSHFGPFEDPSRVAAAIIGSCS